MLNKNVNSVKKIKKKNKSEVKEKKRNYLVPFLWYGVVHFVLTLLHK